MIRFKKLVFIQCDEIWRNFTPFKLKLKLELYSAIFWLFGKF